MCCKIIDFLVLLWVVLNKIMTEMSAAIESHKHITFPISAAFCRLNLFCVCACIQRAKQELQEVELRLTTKHEKVIELETKLKQYEVRGHHILGVLDLKYL